MKYSTELIHRLKEARRVCVLTGAGISAESGVPTFRGREGLWKKHRPEELATPEAFKRNPELVWEWYNFRRKLISRVKPNPGHTALSEIERLVDEFTLVTQNVDGLHRFAGNRNVLELHGNIMRSRCLRCGELTYVTDSGYDDKRPECGCGGLLRPDVVWFGEPLPEAVITAAFKAAENCDIFLCIGTSAVVQPAATLPLAAIRSEGYVVEINRDSTIITEYVNEAVHGKAGELLPELVKDVWG